MIRAILAAALIGGAAFAQDAGAPAVPPATSPAPEPRPDPEARQDEGPIAAIDAETRGGPAAHAVPDAGPGIAEELAEGPEALAACLAELEGAGATFERLDAVSTEEDRDCGIVNPVLLSKLSGGARLTPPITVRCETALSVADWIDRHVTPAAEILGRGEVVRVGTGNGYMCRRRNNSADGPLSEHSFGNAVDITGFEFADGPPVAIEPREDEGTLAEAFQRSVRAASCLYFTTVLGPGADAAHANHLHLDIKERRGGYRLCQ
ncbi:hypothetical protein BCF33_1145 [Hasllibacter halocynthiae]|uniref:Extensin-like C-terminal domain-containing protein n=1 Tax=Hasllibacter halocynthiae TaxID=595589 RepID=A0A2T0X9I2_9RHOB|nr:extensin family protein [Hasllibacter halocynthiae]PRY95524.1 hypothetical protein BCF33_1145 [Hasllibacter halocynthiae]